MKKKSLLFLLAVMLIPSLQLFAHGYVAGEASLNSRQGFCSQLQNYNDKMNCGGSAMYEPNSVGELPDRSFEDGKADGQIHSAVRPDFSELDKPTMTDGKARKRNEVKAGGTYDVKMTCSACHSTKDVKYYMSKPGADLTSIDWKDFNSNPISVVEYDGQKLSTNLNHKLTIPNVAKGDYAIVWAWDVADTASTFYNVLDLTVTDGTGLPTDPVDPPVEPPVEPPVDKVCESPSNLHSMGTTAKSVKLMWNMSSDCVDYTSTFNIFKNNVKIGSTNETEFNVTNLKPSTKYTFKVVDTKNNKTTQFTVTTAAEEVVPPKPEPPVCGNTKSLTILSEYKKGELVTHNGVTKKVVQDFFYWGDENWFDALSLFTAYDCN
ncbi:MAG: lytic polysaccharide monooxygenase [Mycoplasmatales bacterium]